MTGVQWLSQDEERAWRAYRRMNRLLYERLARDLAEETQLSDPDYDVLSTLTEASGHSWRATELAAHLQWSSSRLAHHIRRMEDRGLVRRDACAEDGRGALIRLTKRGLRAIQLAAPAHVLSVRRHFVDLLSAEQLASLEELATIVAGQLSGTEPESAAEPTRQG